MTDNLETTSTQPPPLWKRRAVLVVWIRLMRWVSRTFLVLLLAVTILLTAGRLLAPLLTERQEAMENQLSSLLGAEVEIGQLDGEWFRFGPIIHIGNLRIINADDPAASHVIASLSIKPSVFRSFMNRSLVIERVTVDGPVLDLRQNPDGTWSLAGLVGPAGSSANYTDAILDFLLETGSMQIVEADVSLQWNDGRTLALDNLYLDLGNDNGRHLLQAQARIAGQASPFQIQLDFQGDPRDRFSGSAYIHASELEIHSLLPVPGLELTRAELTGDLWASLDNDGVMTMQAMLEEVNLDGKGSGEGMLGTLALDNTTLTLALKHGPDNHWQAWFDEAEFDWFTNPWSAGGIYLDYSENGDSRPLEITAAGVNLAMLGDVLDDLLVLPEQARQALTDLAPEGRLANLRLSTDLNGSFSNGFLLRGNLEDVAVGAWQGAPSGRGIQGYIQADNARGMLELASSDFGIHLPRVFNDAWHYDAANSRVHWQIEDGLAHINSSVIDVRNDFIHAHVQFDLLNHRNSAGEVQSDLTLLIGILDFDASYKSMYLPTLRNIKGTMDWLDEALLAGHVSNSGFVSRTRVSRNATPRDNTVMTFYNVGAGELKFLPAWPELSGIDAFVSVDNANVDITASAAMIEGIPVANTLGTIRPDPQGGSMLSISGNADTNTALGLALLRNTPVRESIGDFIDDWQGDGSVHIDISLDIPLYIPGRETRVSVDVDSTRSTLTIPAYALSFEDLRGRVSYNNDAGLSANALSGRLFDFPIAATIEAIREGDDDGDFIAGSRIVGSGRASNSALQAWQGQPQFVRDVLNFASGEIDYLAEITIPNARANPDDHTSLRLTSELLGLSLDYPQPFTKSEDQIRPLVMLIDFAEDEEWVSARFDNQVAANLRIRDNEFAGGRIVLGPQARETALGPVVLDEPGLVFSGYAESYDYSAWEQAALNFTAKSAGGDEGRTLADFVSVIDVDVGRLAVIGQELEEVHTRISRAGNLPVDDAIVEPEVADSWLVSLENPLLKGDFLFPDDAGLPWLVDLDYLRFPEAEEPEDPEAEAEDIDVLAEIVPSELHDMNFRTDVFAIGSKELGAWQFLLRTNADSASISDLHMTTPDARIRDFSDQYGANLNWRYSNGIHTSSFTGLFKATDLARVLPGWGFDANVVSSEASFISNLQWTGSPAAFGLEKAVGNVVVNIQDGRFVDVDSGGSRLFGALNFDSLVRRLQLDFSDLYQKGLAYDNINGRLQFNEGIVRTDGAFVINGPSSRIAINGELNLLNETIDADMQVNVPLGQNISVLAGLLGAWPIALSTYIASKIFKDQVNDFTTVLYRLEGPWENPSSGFEPSEEILEAGDAASDAEVTDTPPPPATP